MRQSLPASLALVLLLVPAPAKAQSEYERQVLDILSEVSGFALDQGYAQTRDKLVSALGESESQDHYISFAPGRDYVIVAVCDVDCSDIDLHLYSPAGDEVGADIQPDDVPVIELGNVGGGEHRLEVGMYACSSEPCFYAVGVYVKDGSGGGAPSGGAGAGGEAYVEQVLGILEAFSGLAEERGYTDTGDDWVSALDESESEDQFVKLGGGADYALVAVCDEDCGDMDLAIYDPSGNLVAEDTETDAVPVLEITGARSGEYRIEVRMYQCSSEPCFYAMGLFKRTGKGPAPMEAPLGRR
jgi:hypothetical protein